MFPTKKQPEAQEGSVSWMPLAEVAASVFGMSLSGFAKEIRPLIPAIAVRGAGRKGVEIHAPTAVHVFLLHRTGNKNWKRDIFGPEAR